MDKPQPRAPGDEPGDDEARDVGGTGLFAGVERLFDDGRAYVTAELNYQGERVRVGVSRTKSIVLLLLAAGVLLTLVVIALIVGLLLALAPLITIWGALGLVCGGLLLGSAICFRVAVSRIAALAAIISGDGR